MRIFLIFITTIIGSLSCKGFCESSLIPGYEGNPGVKHFNAGRYKRAEIYFKEQIKLGNEQKHLSYVYLAKYAILQNKGKEAVNYVEQSLEIEPNGVQELTLAAEAYCAKAMQVSMFGALTLGRRCGKYYDLAANAQPPNPQALKNAVWFHWEAPSIAGGSKQSAERYLEQLSKIAEEDSRILRIFQKENESGEKEALELADKYGSTNYMSIENLYELAIYYRDKKQFDKAIALFKRIVESNPPPQPSWHYADAVFQLGEQLITNKIDIKKGIGLIEQYLESSVDVYDPHFFWSRWRLAKAYREAGNLEEYKEIINSIEQFDYSHNESFAKEFGARFQGNANKLNL